MTKHPARMPGDPAPGDRDFGPLGGLPDDVSFSVRSRERERETEARRVMGAADAPRPARRDRSLPWRGRLLALRRCISRS